MHELSGGQQQRVLIAKALVGDPELLVLDEPIAGVDAESQRLFRDSLVHLAAEHGASVLLVSHELGAVAEDLDRVIVLKRTVLFDGKPQDLAARCEPRHPCRGPAALVGRSRLMPWPFDRDYMQLALVAGVVVGACAPLIGAFLVQKRMSLMGDGLGHVAFAGVAAGLLLEVWPIWTALIAAVGGAVLIEWLRTHGRASGDLALALCFYGGIALAVVLASRASAGSSVNVLPYLFGSILTVTWNDVRVIMVLGRDHRGHAVCSPGARSSPSCSTRSRHASPGCPSTR